MIRRFIKINDNLYRGSAPSVKDVIKLHKDFGINKIISLDRYSGVLINEICDKLGIDHYIIPLDGSRKSLFGLLRHNLYSLLMDNGPTFVHCAQGKDRTGFLIALFKCMYMGYSYQKAIKEAESLGFGVGVDPSIIKLYKKVISKAYKNLDNSSAEDIVFNQRSYKSNLDGRGSYLDQATQGSFAPFVSKTRQYPYDNPYNDLYHQSPTRTNYKAINPYIDKEESIDAPLVGIYNNMAGIYGFGPSLNVGGFIND